MVQCIAQTQEHGHVVVSDNQIYELVGDIFGEFEAGRHLGPLEISDLLPPISPSNIYGLGANHHDYSRFLVAAGREPMDHPMMFRKGPEAAVGMAGNLVVPRDFRESGLKGSGELAVFIGRETFKVSPENAAASILGYSIAFDAIPAAKYYGAVDEDDRHSSKGFPTFCPLGPWLTIGADVSDVNQRTYYGDLLILEGRTSGFVWDVNEAISRLSHEWTLMPGDVVLMGAAAPPHEIWKNIQLFADAHVAAGDNVLVEIEQLGTLTMTLADEVVTEQVDA